MVGWLVTTLSLGGCGSCPCFYDRSMNWVGLSVPAAPFSAAWLETLSKSLMTLAMGLVIAAVLLVPAIWVLRRFQVLDIPNERSLHSRVTVRGAGIAITLGWLITVLSVEAPALAFMLPVLALVGVGALDDFRALSARLRLGAQLISAVVLAVGMYVLIRPEIWAVLGVGLVTAFVVATVNAVNFMDGVNGLSTLHAVLWGATYVMILVAYTDPGSPWPIIAAALAGSFLAFAPLNARTRAVAFLGDAGSYGLGAIVASLAVVTWFVTSSWIAALVPLSAYGADTFSTMVKRIARGESLFTAHRQHVYQQVADILDSHLRSAVIILTCSAMLSITAVSFAYALIPLWSVAVIVVSVVLLYPLLPRVLQSIMARKVASGAA